MSGGQPPARFAFRSREAIVDALQIGNQAADMQHALRDVKHSTPNDRTLARICYRAQLMKSTMGISVLRALRKYADLQGLKVEENMFRPATALVEFNYEIVGLGSELARVNSGMLNADVDHVDDIARHVGTSPETIYNAARGRHILVPEEFAMAVSIAASQILKISDPMRVRPRPANETLLRPLGGAGVENGRPAHGCEETTRIRFDVLAWLKRSAADKAA